MTPKSSDQQILHIPIRIGQDYTTSLRERLRELDIKNREICELTGMEETAFSRLFRNSEHVDRPVMPRIDTVVAIETAILKIRQRRELLNKKSKRQR